MKQNVEEPKRTKKDLKISVADQIKKTKKISKENTHIISIVENAVDFAFYGSVLSLFVIDNPFLIKYAAVIKLLFSFYKITITNNLIVLESFQNYLEDSSNKDVKENLYQSYIKKFKKNNKKRLIVLLVCFVSVIIIYIIPPFHTYFLINKMEVYYYVILSLLGFTFFSHYILYIFSFTKLNEI